jgi:hypothetical protein
MSECTNSREWIDGYIDGELTRSDAVRLLAHLRTCAACRDYLRACGDLSEMMRSQLTAEPPKALAANVMSAVLALPVPQRTEEEAASAEPHSIEKTAAPAELIGTKEFAELAELRSAKEPEAPAEIASAEAPDAPAAQRSTERSDDSAVNRSTKKKKRPIYLAAGGLAAAACIAFCIFALPALTGTADKTASGTGATMYSPDRSTPTTAGGAEGYSSGSAAPGLSLSGGTEAGGMDNDSPANDALPGTTDVLDGAGATNTADAEPPTGGADSDKAAGGAAEPSGTGDANMQGGGGELPGGAVISPETSPAPTPQPNDEDFYDAALTFTGEEPELLKDAASYDRGLGDGSVVYYVETELAKELSLQLGEDGELVYAEAYLSGERASGYSTVIRYPGE